MEIVGKVTMAKLNTVFLIESSPLIQLLFGDHS